MARNRPNFAAKKKRLKQLFTVLPKHAGKQYLDFIESNFDKEAFEGKERWPARKQDGSRRQARESRRAILVKTARLKNSFNYRTIGPIVIISTDVPYAERHNEGVKGMPKRQFLGPSQQFDNELQDFIENRLDSIFQ